MYVSSPDDTARREVDGREIGTILFTSVRPEFRGAVRFVLHSCAALRCLPWLSRYDSPLVRQAVPRQMALRAQIACFLASTTKENRNRFSQVPQRIMPH